MFCNRCGKKIESGTLCSECIASGMHDSHVCTALGMEGNDRKRFEEDVKKSQELFEKLSAVKVLDFDKMKAEMKAKYEALHQKLVDEEKANVALIDEAKVRSEEIQQQRDEMKKYFETEAARMQMCVRMLDREQKGSTKIR